MILQDFLYIFPILNIVIRALAIFVALCLIILVGVATLQKKLEPNYNKGFSISVVIYLLLIMFSFIVGFFFIESNNSFANILFAFSLEFYLFHKKSKWKFGIIATILLCISIILKGASIVIPMFLNDFLAYAIFSAVIPILININILTIGILIFILLRKTAQENEALKTYTKPISIGIVLLFIIIPLIKPIINIAYLFGVLIGYHYEIYYWINLIVFLLISLIFIIGIIVLAVGAIKTMSVPLTFSWKKGEKGNPRQIVNKTQKSCPSCGTPLQPGAKFCTNCGNHL